VTGGGGADKIRMKITDIGGTVVVYDSLMGALDGNSNNRTWQWFHRDTCSEKDNSKPGGNELELFRAAGSRRSASLPERSVAQSVQHQPAA